MLKKLKLEKYYKEGEILTIDVHKFFYDKKDKSFTAELSDLDMNYAPQMLYLHNPKTGNKVLFRQIGKDYDASHEDIYGFRYKSDDILFSGTLLLIND
jgi:hypothetical protein